MKTGFGSFSFLKVFPRLKWSTIMGGLALFALVAFAVPVEAQAAPLEGSVAASWLRGNGYYGNDIELTQDTTISLDFDLELQNVELNGHTLTIQGDSSRRMLVGSITGNYGGSALKISGGTVMINGGYIEVYDLTVNGGALTVGSDTTAISCAHSFRVESGKILAKTGGGEDCIESYGDINISGGNVTVISGGRGIHNRSGNISISGSASVDVTAAADAIKTDGNSSITISGAKSVKAAGNTNAIVTEKGNMTISGSTVDTKCAGAGDSYPIYAGGDLDIDNSIISAAGGDTAICAAGNLNVKGRATVIKARAAGSRAMRSSYRKITLGSPLMVASPANAGLSRDKSYIAMTKGGDEPARDAVIEGGLVVKFDGNGQKMYHAPAEQVLVKGSRITQPDPVPMAAGKVFDGWYKDASCKKEWNFYWDTVTADTTLYAKWLGPQITTTSLEAGKVGKPYTVSLSASGTNNSAAWRGMAGNLPAGLRMSDSGEISGVPLKAGKYTFKVAIKDSVGFDSKELTIEIKDK